VLTLLPRLPGDGDNQAAAINAAGVIVGVSKRDTFRFAGTPVTWRDGVIQSLDELPPGVSQDAVASGINALGDVVGSVATMPDTHPDRAVLWRGGDEQATLLPALFATDINDRGEVAMMDFNNHAVVWRDGVPSDLGALPGMEMHIPTAINNQGWVVGFAHGGGQVRGFLWTPETGLQDLTELVLAPGRILHAWDVNDHGQIAATHQVGLEDRGVLLDPSAARPVSEPHVLLLLIVLLIVWPPLVVRYSID